MVKPHAPQTCASANSATRAHRKQRVALSISNITIPTDRCQAKERGPRCVIEAYLTFANRGLLTMPGILPRLAMGLPSTSLMSIVISMGDAPEM